MRARALRAASTDAERLLWSRLRDRRLFGFKFRRQFPIGPFVADFVCLEAKLVVEIDGGQHYSDEAQRDDVKRSRYLEAQGFEVLRFSNRDVMTETAGVLTAIADRLPTLYPHPCPLPQAGEGALENGST